MTHHELPALNCASFYSLQRERRLLLLAIGMTLLGVLGATAVRAEEPPLKLLNGEGHGRMMQRFLLKDVDRVTAERTRGLAERKTPEAIAAHHRQLRSKFIEAIGGLPPHAPPKAKVTGVVKRDGFTVEKILLESRPNHHITAALFLPAPASGPAASSAAASKPPYPVVLLPCGHAELAKADPKYQKAAALLALNGIAAMLFDPIDQGERMQIVDAEGKYPFWGTKGHLTLGIGSIFLGNNTAQFMIYDGMRAIDYLQSRSDIDGDRIGCMGNSGGGTQTAYLAALDDRIKAAAPSCYITSFSRLLHSRGGQDSEQTIFGQLAWGMDHAEYLTMRVPTPQLVCATTGDFFDIRGSWESFRQAKQLYSRLGYAERINIIEHDGPHGYARPLREASTRWMSRWLKKQDLAITEPEIEVLSPQEIQVTPRGQVMLLPRERSVYDLNDELLAELTKRRGKFDPDRVRELAGVRPLAEIPEPRRMLHQARDISGVPVHPEVLELAGGIRLPTFLTFDDPGALGKTLKQAQRPRPSKGRLLFLHERGKSADMAAIKRLYDAGYDVMAVDLRGTGETLQTNGFFYARRFGSDGLDVIMAYLLGKSYVGMRTEDVLVAARRLRDAKGSGDLAGKPVRLIATGHVTVPALHAAALEPELFSAVELHDGLESWAQIIRQRESYRQLVNHVHGALSHYDLPDLVAAIRAADVAVEIHNPRDAMGRLLKP